MKKYSIAKYVLFIFIFLSCFISTNIKVYALDDYVQKIDLGDKIEKHWWGYRRYVSNDQISKFSSQFDSMAAEFSFFGGLVIPISILNPLAGILIGGILEFSSSYCWLLSTYIVKSNKGRGVIIDFSNGVVFRIKGV